MTAGQGATCSKGEKRRAEILEAARILFLEKGYAGTSMDAVAERVGSSKETLYSYFGSKAGLLKCIIERISTEFRATLDEADDGRPIAAYLDKLADGYMRLIHSTASLALYRLVIAESARMPEIGDVFYRTCPETFIRRLSEYFSRAAERQEIVTADPYRLAVAFYAMLRGELHMRALFNPTRAATEAELDEQKHYALHSILSLCHPVTSPNCRDGMSRNG